MSADMNPRQKWTELNLCPHCDRIVDISRHTALDENNDNVFTCPRCKFKLKVLE